MSRERYKSRELEISGDGIVEIFQSEKFKKKIFGIADKLRNSDEYYESGFVVVKGLRAKSFDTYGCRLLFHGFGRKRIGKI